MPFFNCGNLINIHHRNMEGAIKQPCQITGCRKCLFNETKGNVYKFAKQSS